MSVYITSTGHFLPGPAIPNEEIEEILGKVRGKSSRLKKKILDSNGIVFRHLAINKNHETYISNQSMAANAGVHCLDDSALELSDIDHLSCATSQGDMVLPGFASLVQAELELPDVEIHSAHGICSSSLMALKHAYLNLKCDEHQSALVIASELVSRLFKSTRYEQLDSEKLDFNAEFLRWMLSDGAGACLLERRARGRCFRVDWIKSFSHADAFPTCMSVGAPSDVDDQRTWQDYGSYAEAERAGALVLRQDVRLLDNIVKLGVDGFLRLIDQGLITPQEIDHVLCHFSSHYFKGKIFELMVQAGVAIPEERWYTNLYTRGNTGCASILIMLDEFFRTQDYSVGDTVICMVPESGRFNVAYMKLTVVEQE
jgi:3-oxoacyl-[acyl-carrier-protein] synthase-3